MSTVIAVNGSAPLPSKANEFPVPLTGSVIIQLDTGRVVEMVVAELSMLYEAGEIPDELTPIASKVLFAPAKEEERDRERSYLDRLRLAKWVVKHVLRQPRVVEEPQTKYEIKISDLYHDEIWQIYQLANSPSVALATFRRQQAGHVAALSGRQDVGAEAEPAAHSPGAA